MTLKKGRMMYIRMHHDLDHDALRFVDLDIESELEIVPPLLWTGARRRRRPSSLSTVVRPRRSILMIRGVSCRLAMGRGYVPELGEPIILGVIGS